MIQNKIDWGSQTTMAIYFEKRKYSKEEIASILGITNLKTQFKRSVTTKLQNLGFTEEDYIYTRKDVTILWVPTKSKEKITYLIRLLGIDTKVNPHNFAMFLYGLIVSEDLQAMPWAERSNWLHDNWNIDVTERTLRRWTSKLLELGVLTKERQYGTWWCSSKFEGEVFRSEVTDEEELETVKEYWKDWRKWRSELGYKETFSKLWQKYSCTYYKCPAFLTCAWNEPIIAELLGVIAEYVQEYWMSDF